MVSLPTFGTRRRFTASSATSRTVQPDRPGRRIAADHRDNPLSLRGRQQCRRAGALLVVKSLVQT
jgi:hypothetical protein